MFDILKKMVGSQIPAPGKIEYLVVGLGNPTQKYENTRHNAGFLAVDYIAKQAGVEIDRTKYHALFADTVISGKRLLLIKPQTFMNLSGESVVQFMSFYKIPSEKTVVVFDDVSLDPGHLRIRKKGSAGGHNGMKNIIESSGKDTFLRIKLGVGNRPNGWELADWVLSKIPNEDRENLQSAIKNSYESLKLILCDKTDEAMNKFNA